MKITYFGHSVLLLETGGTRVLVDPFITDNPMAEPLVSVDEVEADVILITHAHMDHWGDTERIATRTGAMVVANHEIVTWLTNKTGHSNTLGMNVGGSCDLGWGRVTQTYARHSSSFPDGTYGGNPNGYLVQIGAHCVYILGDTATFVEMEWIGRESDIDIAFIPIGDRYTMGVDGALQAAKMLRPALSVPVHYNTFPPIQVDVGRWEGDMSTAGLPTLTMLPGETHSM
jgi:L-ascorbate metabolism protein UlaG (beta-lactamase superfamily)